MVFLYMVLLPCLIDTFLEVVMPIPSITLQVSTDIMMENRWLDRKWQLGRQAGDSRASQSFSVVHGREKCSSARVHHGTSRSHPPIGLECNNY